MEAGSTSLHQISPLRRRSVREIGQTKLVCRRLVRDIGQATVGSYEGCGLYCHNLSLKLIVIARFMAAWFDIFEAVKADIPPSEAYSTCANILLHLDRGGCLDFGNERIIIVEYCTT